MRLWTPLLQGFTSDQMRLAEENTALIEQREKEIQSIVQSISELNEIFRDLATMIVEQVRQTRLTVFCRNKLSQVSQNTSAFYENWLSNKLCLGCFIFCIIYCITLFIPKVLTEWKGQMEQRFVNFFLFLCSGILHLAETYARLCSTSCATTFCPHLFIWLVSSTGYDKIPGGIASIYPS